MRCRRRWAPAGVEPVVRVSQAGARVLSARTSLPSGCARSIHTARCLRALRLSLPLAYRFSQVERGMLSGPYRHRPGGPPPAPARALGSRPTLQWLRDERFAQRPELSTCCVRPFGRAACCWDARGDAHTPLLQPLLPARQRVDYPRQPPAGPECDSVCEGNRRGARSGARSGCLAITAPRPTFAPPLSRSHRDVIGRCRPAGQPDGPWTRLPTVFDC